MVGRIIYKRNALCWCQDIYKHLRCVSVSQFCDDITKLGVRKTNTFCTLSMFDTRTWIEMCLARFFVSWDFTQECEGSHSGRPSRALSSLQCILNSNSTYMNHALCVIQFCFWSESDKEPFCKTGRSANVKFITTSAQLTSPSCMTSAQVYSTTTSTLVQTSLVVFYFKLQKPCVLYTGRA